MTPVVIYWMRPMQAQRAKSLAKLTTRWNDGTHPWIAAQRNNDDDGWVVRNYATQAEGDAFASGYEKEVLVGDDDSVVVV